MPPGLPGFSLRRAGEPGRADGCEEVSADHGADDPEDEVKQQALT